MPGYLAEHLRFVSCAANPLDLRPARDAIVADVLRRRAELPEDRPFVLIMSEHHDKPTHVALREMVVSMLRDTVPGTLAVGYEGDHDFFEKRILKVLKPKLSLADRRKAAFEDNEGRCLLAGLLLSSKVSLYAINTHNHFLSFCHLNHISFRFNDAAQVESFIDFNDSTANYLRRSLPVPARWNYFFTSVHGRHGMALRNNVIVSRALDHVSETKALIYVQHCGLHHMFGSRSSNMAFKDSLASLFKAAGATVCSPFITTPGCDTRIVPVEAQSALRNNLVLNGIDPKSFSIIRGSFEKEQEQEFQYQIHKATGGEYEILPIDEEQLRQDFDADVEKCLRAPDSPCLSMPISALTVS